MNFLISEDEYNRLHAVQRQLNMMSRLFLCGDLKGYETPCEPGDLGEFFEAQQSAIDDVRKAITNRWELTNTVNKPMRWMDWLTVMETASGDYAALHPKALNYIDDALSKQAAVEPEYELVVKKWLEVSGRYARPQAA